MTAALPEAFPEILEAARAGKSWAWSTLYRGFAPRVLRYLKARRVIEPEDVLGDVFLKVVEKLEGFQGGAEEFGAWLVTIAHRRVLDNARARARRPVDPAPLMDLMGDRVGGSVEEDALENLAAERTEMVLQRLSPDQRDVMFLRIIGDLSLEQTAAALGKSVGAVKSLQSRAVAAIRREMAKEAISL